MSIFSLNIWDLPILSARGRRRRIVRIASYLSRLNPDIICLQESFDIRNRDFLYQNLDPRVYRMTKGAKTRKTLFMNFDSTGGLVTFSKFPIISSRFVPFNRFLNSTVPEFFSRKGFLDSVVQTPHGLFRIVNTHLHQQSLMFDSYVRQSQLRYALRSLERTSAYLPTVIAGDLNEDNLVSKKPFSRVLARAEFSHPAEGRLVPTYRPENPYVDTLINRIREPKRLDYMFVRHLHKIGLKVTRYQALHLTPSLSDHDPVMLELAQESGVSFV